MTPARRSIGRPWKSLSSRERILRYLTSSVSGGSFSSGTWLRQLQTDSAPGRRVEADGGYCAIKVSRRIRERSSRD